LKVIGGPIIAEGRNCWRRPTAERIAFLVDAAQYYAAFIRAVERAERVVRILAWDINSRTPLLCGQPGGPPRELGEVLFGALERNRDLHIYVLSWDFVSLYASDREPRFVGLAPGLHPRLHFHFDGCQPKLACHHQKVAVVDDALAFAGGLELTAPKWDTPAHRPQEPNCPAGARVVRQRAAHGATDSHGSPRRSERSQA
jgi:phospholipase D1/2